MSISSVPAVGAAPNPGVRILRPARRGVAPPGTQWKTGRPDGCRPPDIPPVAALTAAGMATWEPLPAIAAPVEAVAARSPPAREEPAAWPPVVAQGQAVGQPPVGSVTSPPGGAA